MHALSAVRILVFCLCWLTLGHNGLLGYAQPVPDSKVRFEIKPKKDAFILGEPVILTAEFKNLGDSPAEIFFGENRFEAYKFHIMDEKGKTVAKPERYLRLMPPRLYNYIFEGFDPVTGEVKPGGIGRQHLILDMWYPIVSVGVYKIRAEFGGTRPCYRVNLITGEKKTIGGEREDLYTCEFSVKVIKPDDVKLRHICEEYIEKAINKDDLFYQLAMMYFRNPIAVPYLERMVEHFRHSIETSPVQVYWGIEGLGTIGSYEAVKVLIRLYRDRKLGYAHKFIIAWLGHISQTTRERRIQEMIKPVMPHIRKGSSLHWQDYCQIGS